MIVELAPFFAAWMLGFAGSGHCVAMCGGVIGALSLRPGDGQSGLGKVLAYNFGRILSYILMGTIAAGVLAGAARGELPVLRTLAAILLMLMGLHFLGWRKGLQRVEQIGRGVWQILQPLNRRLMAGSGLRNALLLGVLWGWLPCGLVYSALAYAATQGGAMAGGISMLCFGLGTAPALVATGYFASSVKRWLNKRTVTRVIGVSYILFALWTLASPWSHLLRSAHGEHSGHSMSLQQTSAHSRHRH